MNFSGSSEDHVESVDSPHPTDPTACRSSKSSLGSCTGRITTRFVGYRKFIEGGCLLSNSKGERARTINDFFPAEILFAIFDFATAPSRPTIPNFTRVVSLTHVSRLWREILLANGRLWSNIHIMGQPLDVVATQIARCRRAPLSIFIEAPLRSITKSSHYAFLRTNIQRAARLVQERRDQVKRLEIRMDRRALVWVFDSEESAA